MDEEQGTSSALLVNSQDSPTEENSEPSDVNTADKKKKELGVAFSGGGIRSAAFCSGVLRRMLHQKKEPDYLSCVSGGGYTGSAYVQWKYHHSNEWTPEVVNKFFDHMRERAGLFCNWRKGCSQGCIDAFIATLLIIIVMGVSLVIWISLAFPIAFVVKLLYGQILNDTSCRDQGGSTHCSQHTYLFSLAAGIFMIFHLLDYFIKYCRCVNEENYKKIHVIKTFSRLMQVISGVSLAFTFIPWFIKFYLIHTHVEVRIVIIIPAVILWFFFPILRSYSSLVLIIYGYSYVVYWHVYEATVRNEKYSEQTFRLLLSISLWILAVAAVFGDFQLHLVHIYNRWRLQKAFYYFKDEEKCWSMRCELDSCCYDLFPGSHILKPCGCKCPPDDADTTEAVKLSDLKTKNVKPTYISNAVINGWQRNLENSSKENYCHVAMTPEEIYVIDNQQRQPANNNHGSEERRAERKSVIPLLNEKEQLTNKNEEAPNTVQRICIEKLKSRDIKLSSAMAMSAAAVSPYLGKLKNEQRLFTHALTVLGLEMAARIVYDIKQERDENVSCRKAFCSFLSNVIIFSIIASFGVIIYCDKFPLSSLELSPVITAIILLTLIFCCEVITIVSTLAVDQNTTSDTNGCVANCVRWMDVHIHLFRVIRAMLGINTKGPTPPAMMHVSDGGHFENYGILTLLERKLPKIVIADGSLPPEDEKYGNEIIQAMEYARNMLGCSFTTMKGQDVLTGIKETYEKAKDGRFPRTYKFQVHYKGCSTPGEIILLAPRHPRKGIESHPTKTWKDLRHDSLDGDWGEGPFLKEDEVKRIEGCPAGCGCCTRCHNTKFSFFARFCNIFSFPRHTTGLQFFTPTMFAIYHREGYRAAMECDFLSE